VPKLSQEERVTRADLIYHNTEDARSRYTQKWYQNEAFYENNHFVMWNAAYRTIDRISAPVGRVMRAIPKARRQVKAIQNMILSNDTRWTVLPDEAGPKAEDAAKRTNEWLRETWQKINVRNKLDALIIDSCNMTHAWLEAGFDKYRDEVYVDEYDAFDILTPSWVDSDNYEDSPFIMKTVRKTMAELEELYGKGKVRDLAPDNKMAANLYKEYRLNEKIQEKVQQDSDLQTVIVYVLYEKQKRQGQKNLICRTTYAGKRMLEYLEYESNSYPFVPYSPQTGSFYQPALIEEFIPTNKALDMMVSHIENYTNLMVRGRYMIQEGNNISRMANEDGEILTYRTTPPEQQQIYPLPNFLFTQMGNYEKWIEESGVSTSALGKAPKGIRAYKAIESLKQSDFANLRVPIKNLEDCLQKLTEKIIDIAAENYILPKTVYKTKDDVPDNFSVIGEKGAALFANQSMMQGEAAPTVIKQSYRIKCTVESGLSYTEEGKKDTLWQLFQGGVIGQKTLLEGYKFGNVAETMEDADEGSMIPIMESAEFHILPPEMQKMIVTYLNQPDILQMNPIARSEMIKKKRKGRAGANTSFKKQ
jgi:hypothetical protein